MFKLLAAKLTPTPHTKFIWYMGYKETFSVYIKTLFSKESLHLLLLSTTYSYMTKVGKFNKFRGR